MARPPAQFVYDGLWRCLCPAFDAAALRQAITSSQRRRPNTARRAPTCGRSRPYSIASVAVSPAPPTRRSKISHEDPKPFIKTIARHPHASLEDVLLSPTAPSQESLFSFTFESIIQALHILRSPDGWSYHGQDIDRHARIVLLVRHLVQHRKCPLSAFVYECMMDAMVDPQGSAVGVRKLLKEMSAEGIKPTASLCQSALEALAVHPDYFLRQEVLDIMREFWFPVDVSAQQKVALGLLRDKQYELAYARLSEMIDRGDRVTLWVYDIFILTFGQAGFLDEMMLLLYRRKNAKGTDAVMFSLYHYVLDICSRAYHHAGTIFAWTALARRSRMAISDGIVENVLGTAVRHGDVELATQALEAIAIPCRIQQHHYEAVAEAFLRGDDFPGALRILCIMKRSGTSIGRAETRAVYEALKSRPSLARGAEAALRALRAELDVPSDLIAAVVEALAEINGSESVSKLYGDFYALSRESPSAILIQDMIAHSSSTELISQLAGDYVKYIADFRQTYDQPCRDDASEKKRDGRTYEVLILRCIEAGETSLAFRFAKQAAGVSPGEPDGQRPGWIKTLVDTALRDEDGRIWDLLDELDRHGDQQSVKYMHNLLTQSRINRRTDEDTAARSSIETKKQ